MQSREPRNLQILSPFYPVKQEKTVPTVPIFSYYTDYQRQSDGYVCEKLCRYCADTVPMKSALIKHSRSVRAYANGRSGIRERLFGHTQTVASAVLRPCLRRAITLVASSLHRFRTMQRTCVHYMATKEAF